ncbi:co-chaperone GroES [bacterium]|nr:co-chaperone GroES [bacterium]
MGKLKIRPLGDRIVVEPLEAVEKTKGGIILPDSAKEKPQEGKIVAIGKGKTDDSGKVIEMEVKVGDKVLYGKYAGTEINIDNVEYMILREEDVLAVIDEK